MPRRIRDSVVVITGASSGIGRATALALADKGASLILAARRESALAALADECRTRGGAALPLRVDVTDESAVRELAERAIATHGRIDVWVNNAAVTLFSRFEEAPPDAYRRVIETNLFGYIHGARAALPYFREQGSGILVHVDSVVGVAAQPYASAYVASKFAIRGLADSLRMELHLDEAPEIRVCTVLPSAIDTPLFQHGANYTGRKPRPVDPVYSAERVARAVVRVIEKPRREIVVGGAGRLIVWQARWTPELYERMAARQVDRRHFSDDPVEPSRGNLFEPMPGSATVSGGWRQTGERALRRKLAAAIALAVGSVLIGRRLQRYLREPARR